jgi:hypothetical protein
VQATLRLTTLKGLPVVSYPAENGGPLAWASARPLLETQKLPFGSSCQLLAMTPHDVHMHKPPWLAGQSQPGGCNSLLQVDTSHIRCSKQSPDNATGDKQPRALLSQLKNSRVIAVLTAMTQSPSTKPIHTICLGGCRIDMRDTCRPWSHCGATETGTLATTFSQIGTDQTLPNDP